MSIPLQLDLPPWMKKHIKPIRSDPNARQIYPIISKSNDTGLPNVTESADTREYSQFWQIAEFSEKLLNKADHEEIVIGLDLDFPGDYKAVLSKTSVIHICYEKNKCCTLKVSDIRILPKALTLLIKHPQVKLAGYSLPDDIKKLGKDFGFDVIPVLEKIASSETYPCSSIYCVHNWDLESATENANSKLKQSELGTEPTIQKKPLFRFRGKLKYSNHLSTCGAAAEELLALADKCSGDNNLVLGFDLEWPFGIRGVSGKVALVQICPDEHQCYLLHIPKLTSLPKTLVLLLNHKRVRLVGVNIANDIRKLGRDFRIETQYILSHNIIELGSFANKVLNISDRWSLSRLVLHMLGKELEKPVNVRCSDWSQDNLSGHQLVYAASDAYAGLAVYNYLTTFKDQSKKDL